MTRQATALLQAIGLPATLGSFLVIFLAVQLLKSGLAIFSKYGVLRAKLEVQRALTFETFEDCFRTRWLFFSANKQGVIVNTFLHEIAVVGDAFGQLALLFANLIQLVCYLAVPFCLSWQMTSLSLVAALVFAWPLLWLGKSAYRLGKVTTATANEMGTVIQESFTLAKLVLGFGNQHKSLADLKRTFESHRRAVLKARTLVTATPLMYEPVAMAVLVITVFAAQRFAMPLSEIAVLLWTLRNAIPLLGSLAAQKNALSNCSPSYEQITRLRGQARAFTQPSGAKPFDGLRQGIAIERVSFAYPDHEPILREVSLVIPKGKMIALVGESGAGKSTLIDLVMGFLEPTAGRVTVDGVPLSQFNIDSYRSRIGYVPQDSVLFNRSIRDNLRWAHETATDAEIRAACRQANADEFIERFPEGYDTVVGDRGVRLSGGQCQRMALARAILRKPELLILDEATSALDTHSERLIQQAIETVARETTVIIIAHRLSTIINADYVYVLSRGAIVEEGAYQDLVRRQGPFSRMTQMQLLEAAV